MSILSDRDIMAAVQRGDINIEPFDPSSLGTNSYDVHLAKNLVVYEEEIDKDYCGAVPLDCLKAPLVRTLEIPIRGLVLKPGELYLGVTVEYTESHKHVPFLEGKSSLGRLGMSIHVTAGKGDVGFCNHWTMEITVVKPLRVYAGMPCGQLIWHQVSSDPIQIYSKKPSAKYQGKDPMPQPSRMHKNADNGKWITMTDGLKKPPRKASP